MTTKLTPFALRTSDSAWIERNKGQVDKYGRITVLVPANEIETVKMAGNDWLRHHFTDCPRDMANPWIMCPAKWVV